MHTPIGIAERLTASVRWTRSEPHRGAAGPDNPHGERFGVTLPTT